MTPKDIRKALIEAEVTAAAIGRDLGVTRAAVHQVIHGRRATPRIRAAIAAAIGMDASEVWGDAPDETGAAAGPLHLYSTGDAP